VTLVVKDGNTQLQSLSTQVDASGNLVPVHTPAAVVAGIAVPASATAPIPVINAAGSPAVDGSGTITTGGTAQNLFSGTVPTNGYLVANPNASDALWICEGGTAAVNGAGSIEIAAGANWNTPSGYKPFGVVSILGPNTADKFTARRW
jgi:hypothetical protein